jgi:sec-independent protein translocase protein TatA
MGFLSPWHWLFILLIAVLLFGNRLPEIARSLGRSVNEFKRGLRDVKDNLDAELNDDSPRERLQPPAEKREPEQIKQPEPEQDRAPEQDREPSETHRE